MQSRRPFMYAAILLATLVGSACQANSLTGTMSSVFSLAFTTVIVYQQDNYLSIDYDNSTDVVCQVIVDTTGLKLDSSSSISGTPFLKNVQFERASVTGGSYPTSAKGSLGFSSYSTTVGGHIAGSFDVLFVDSHTLSGDFSGTLAQSPL